MREKLQKMAEGKDKIYERILERKEEEYEEVYDEKSALMEFYLVNICGTKPEVARREVVMKVKKQKENNNEQE